MLVRGNAGVGKTALLRTICGLWPMGSSRPHSSDIKADARSDLCELVRIPPYFLLATFL